MTEINNLQINNAATATNQFRDQLNKTAERSIEQAATQQLAPGVQEMARQSTVANGASIVAQVLNQALAQGVQEGIQELNTSFAHIQQVIANGIAQNVIDTQKKYDPNTNIELPQFNIQTKSLQQAIAEKTEGESSISLAYQDDMKRIEASSTPESDLPDVDWD